MSEPTSDSDKPLADLWWMDGWSWEKFMTLAATVIEKDGLMHMIGGVITPQTTIHYQGQSRPMQDWLTDQKG